MLLTLVCTLAKRRTNDVDAGEREFRCISKETRKVYQHNKEVLILSLYPRYVFLHLPLPLQLRLLLLFVSSAVLHIG